jgi:hypothetical protein
MRRWKKRTIEKMIVYAPVEKEWRRSIPYASEKGATR